MKKGSRRWGARVRVLGSAVVVGNGREEGRRQALCTDRDPTGLAVDVGKL